MPELPEVETLRRDLLACLPGEQVVAAEVLRAASIGYPKPPEIFCEQLIGQVFTEQITRRGKYLLLHLKAGASLGVHLRMSGRLLWRSTDVPPETHLRVRRVMASGHELRFEDMRVFGQLWLIPSLTPPEQIMTGLKRLGPEPFDAAFSAEYLVEKFRGRSQPVKSALLDQHLVAGIGNIYADESLFISRIHPLTPVQKLSLEALVRLRQAVVDVLTQGIAQRGTTLRNYTDAQGVNGNYAGTAWAYGRKGLPCRICGTSMERIRLAGRSSHFCPTCQSLE